MATWRKGHGVDPVGTVTESDIDTWWAAKNTALPHNYDDCDGYIRHEITVGIGIGHTVTHGVKEDGSGYFLTISGPSINRSWT